MTECESCGADFAAKRRDARFCSPRCRKIASRRAVTDNAPGVTLVTDNSPGAVAVTDMDLIDTLGGKIQRGDRLTQSEIADGIRLCERALDAGIDGDDEWIAMNVLARLDVMAN